MKGCIVRMLCCASSFYQVCTENVFSSRSYTIHYFLQDVVVDDHSHYAQNGSRTVVSNEYVIILLLEVLAQLMCSVLRSVSPSPRHFLTPPAATVRLLVVMTGVLRARSAGLRRSTSASDGVREITA